MIHNLTAITTITSTFTATTTTNITTTTTTFIPTITITIFTIPTTITITTTAATTTAITTITATITTDITNITTTTTATTTTAITNITATFTAILLLQLFQFNWMRSVVICRSLLPTTIPFIKKHSELIQFTGLQRIQTIELAQLTVSECHIQTLNSNYELLSSRFD